MQKLKRILRNVALCTISFVLLGAGPAVAFADEPETYTYDAKTGRWNSNKWIYDKATNVYIPAPPESPPPKQTTIEEDEPEAEEQIESAEQAANAASAESNATVDDTVTGTSDTDIATDTDIQNELNSDSKTGDAGVVSNTKAGDALTGDANADTTIINSIHSTVDGETAGVAQFTMNVYGDVVGDITIGPAVENAEINKDINLDSETNVDNDSAITNDVKIKSKSGNATVSKNTEAGNAKSGDANAVANVLNLINTIIAANKSFIGTINIYGNLNGDILVSPDFIPQLLASNAVSTVDIEVPLSMNLNDDQEIVNNIDLNATTGDATVLNNTSAGNAKTGKAQTKLTVLNLTGHEVDAKNSLLVFVNVLGKWVGMIVDAPGATSAALGNGVVNHDIKVSDETNINNNSKIVNNIGVDAESGDASVTGNTKAGDAMSGDATASANIANISTSTFKLTDWFGILFINVFGTWIGSFGIDTEAGTAYPLSGIVKKQKPTAGAPNLQFGFIPKDSGIQEIPAEIQSLLETNKDVINAAANRLNDDTSGTAAVAGADSQDGNPAAAMVLAAGVSALGAYIASIGFRRWMYYREVAAV